MEKTMPSSIQAALIFLYVVVIQFALGQLQEYLSPATILWINQLGVFFVPLWMYARWKKMDLLSLVRLKAVDGKTIFLSVLCGLGVFPLFLLISGIFETILNLSLGEFVELQVFMEKTRVGGLNFFLFVVGIVVLAPIFEELLFRGFIQQGLGGFSHKKGWIVTGVLFGFLHFGNHISNAVGAIFLGLVLSYIAFTTQSVLPAIIVHGVVNGVGALFVHIPQFAGKDPNIFWMLHPGTLFLAGFLVVYTLKHVTRGDREDVDTPSYGAKPVLLMLLACTLLLSFALYELEARTQDTREYSSIKAERVDGLMLATVEVTRPSTFFFTLSLKADVLDGDIQVLGESQRQVWNWEHVYSREIFFDLHQEVLLMEPGTYTLVMGAAENLELSLWWSVRPLE